MRDGMEPSKECEPTWTALEQSLDEERRLHDEIDAILRDPDRSEAERRVLEEYAPRMDAAMARSRESLRSFIGTLTRK